MKPLFPFYGSKWRSAKLYGPPSYSTVIEPFAGSAGYSIYWEPQSVVLMDADEILVGVWNFLIGSSPQDILALPDLLLGQSTDDLTVCQEAKWFIGFWINHGSASPKKTQTAFSRRTDKSQLVWSARARERVAADVPKIKHWRCFLGSYKDIAATQATWFVDPPYADKGKYYRKKFNDFQELGNWCKGLDGQVFVCENQGADWLPFQPLASIKSTTGRSEEVVWRGP